MLDVSPVRAFSDNYIWMIRAPADPDAAIVVDPGDDRPVEQALRQANLQLRAILITHHHADHVGGVGALAARHGATVYGPARERMPCEAQALDDGGTADLGHLGLEFAVMAIPGHTLGHIAYVGHGALFCGDTLFSAGCGRLFEGTPAQMLDSLDRISELPDATRVYCGHEYTLSNLRFASAVEPDNPDVREALAEAGRKRERDEVTLPSTLGRELRINPFLRSRTSSVRAAAERHVGRPLDSATDVFAAVRAWKDGFR
ncbi:MAG TPA: hydroxyacylglutathione hydrolase [Steroidobacteraceae bacterium]|nr:hydroxyacylglutathione hydrolase [Steroidobacteraceae bacterium]